MGYSIHPSAFFAISKVMIIYNTEAEDMPATVSLVFSMTAGDSLSIGNMASNIMLWPHNKVEQRQ